MPDTTSSGELRRHLNVFTLTAYGVGVMVGAGIYILVGEVVRTVGSRAWMAFILSAVAALPTALSYAELASRHPRSAGEAVYMERAFGRDSLAFLVGFFVIASGIASVAAVSHGFFSYLAELFPLPAAYRIPTAVVFLIGLSWINHRGIRESTWVNVTLTTVSVAALLLLLGLGASNWSDLPPAGTWPEDPFPLTSSSLLAAAALSFYAFIGFEDMCNVAEEVRHPERTIPLAILLSLGIVTLIYSGIALTAVTTVPLDILTEHKAPLMALSEQLLPDVSSAWIAAIALLAVTNTALFNLIMASRVLYGMARSGWIPPIFARIHPKRSTPTLGIVTAFILAAGFATTGVLRVLAESTNVVILVAFFAVNASLLAIRIRKRAPDDPEKTPFRVPVFVPVLGMLVTGYLITQFSPGAYLRAGALAILGVLLYLLRNRWSGRQS